MFPCMTMTITVEGMTCGHCEQTVEEALEEVSSVTAVTVDRKSEQARVDGEAEVTALVEAVEDAGYTAHA
jgi:copper chaperone